MDPTLLAGSIGAAAALLTYAGTQKAKRNDDQRKMYANAMLAVSEFQEMPYRIARRTDDHPETMRQLDERVRQVQERLNYYRFLLRLESPRVADAFEDLLRKTRDAGNAHRRSAWDGPPMLTPEGRSKRISFPYENQHELAVCVAQMRREVRGLTIGRRRRRQPH
jgi:hypothetical protein